MSDFLINLARRGAGLPAGQSNAQPPVREYQPLSENLEQDQLVETSELAVFEPGGQPTFEATPPRRAQTSAMSQAQAPHEPPAPQLPQVALTPVPQVALTPGRAGLIQRSKEANNLTATPPSETRSPAPSEVGQDYPSQASVTSPKVVRQFHSPLNERLNERPSSSFATTQPLTESVVLARPRFSANEESRMSDSQGPGEPSRTMLSDAGKALQIVSSAETREHALEGERQRERDPDRSGVVTLTPRLPVIEDRRLARLSNIVPEAADVASMPIHVRIGKVEVRAAPATGPPTAAPVGPAPIGFGSYYRLRTYRS